jgi:hypothetical protein
MEGNKDTKLNQTTTIRQIKTIYIASGRCIHSLNEISTTITNLLFMISFFCIARGEDPDYGKMVAQYKYEQLDGVKSCSIETTFRIIG